MPTQAAETATGASAAAGTAAAEVPGAATGTGEMRQLKGKLTIAIQGALPAPGAPATRGQEAWQRFFDTYKKHQPNVEIEIIDLPAGQTGEEWCEANKQAKTLPDISMIGECNYFRPSPEEVQKGLNIAMDFAPFENEINPYSGKPWQEDWLNDYWRKGRCTERGAYDMWTCMIPQLGASALSVNMDILKEYGYDDMPKNYTELWALSDQINKDGKYVAWDAPSWILLQFGWIMFTNLAMDSWQAAGGDLNNLQVSNGEVYKEPNNTINLCNGNFTASNNPSIQEALQQTKRFPDAFPGGAAAFFDPARTESGTQWITGQAAFAYGAGGYGAILNAKEEGTWGEFNWATKAFPKLAKEDLINKDLPIYFDGEPFHVAGGAGDIFAPTPNVRASGEDPNVDLMVRDFFQFMSSPEGNQRVVDSGGIPANAELFKKLPPELQAITEVKKEVFTGVTQPPGTMANWILAFADNEKNLEAWMAGQLDFETAMKKADENATREMVSRLEDQLQNFGLTELPEPCKPWATR